MAEKGKPEVAPQKRSLKLSPALGDWTTYKPPRSLIKRVKVGLYGFDRLSEEELKRVHKLHYRYAEAWLAALKINLNLGGELFAVEAYQNTYGNFLRSVLGPLYQGRIKLPEFYEEVFLSFDLPLISTLTSAALGIDCPTLPKKEITEADTMVVETALSEYLNVFLGAWPGVIKNASIESVGSPDITVNPAINTQNTYVYFVIELSLNDSHGRLILGYPGQLIKSLLKKLEELVKPKPLPLNKIKKEMLNNITLPVSAILGRTELSTLDIKKLEAGDVVSLDGSIKSAITVAISDQVVVLGQPGLSRDHAVVRVVGVEKEKEVKVAPPLPLEPEPAPAPAPTPAPSPIAKPAAPVAVAAKPVPPPLKPSFGLGRKPLIPPPPPPKPAGAALKEEEEFPEEELDLEDEEFTDEDLLDEDFEDEELEEEEQK